MSSIVNLTNTINIDHRAAPLHALLNNASLSNFIQSISSSSYNTNWSISHIPGPPSSFLTYSLSSSSLLTTTIVATEDRYYPFWLLVIVAIFGSVTSVLTVLGNILVMLAFFLDRQIRQPTNYFILSLSVSDFLIGLLSMPLLTIYIYAKEWPLNAIICDIWLSLDYTVCLTSIYTVLFITIDRFCSVKMPAKYRKWRTRRKINIMIAVTWAVPTLIFFTSTMVYPRVRGISNLQNGVCDVQWNKNHVFNLCLTIGYFWTTLFVMIILYIFIYGVASNLERKSRENARKMSSLVGTARNAMTQIGAGIGGNKSPTKPIIDKRNCSNRKMDSTTADDYDDEDPQNLLAHSVINTQNSSNSSDQRRIGGVDDDNSNSFESHSDFDLANPSEKKSGTSNNSNEKSSRQKNRRGMSVNWSNNQTSTINVSSTRTHTDRRSRPSRAPSNQKHASNVKFFATSMAHSLYRNPIRLSGLSSTLKTKGSNPVLNKNSTQLNSNQQQVSATLTPIPSEPELLTCRVNPPPQPRPESLAIMSEELFHQRLKARQSPLLIGTPMKPSITSSLNVNQQLSAKFPSTSSFLLDKHCIEDVTYSTPNQIISTSSDQTIINQTTPPPSPEEQQKKLIEIKDYPIEISKEEEQKAQEQEQEQEQQLQQQLQLQLQQQQEKEQEQQESSSSIKTIINTGGDSSDESWRLLNSNSSLDEHIPYIDETDFEDLGYILHRRRVPPIDSSEPIHEETIIYKSPFYIKNKHRSKSSIISLNNTTNDNGINRKIYEIYGNYQDAHNAILESPIFDNVELITYACTQSDASPIRHCSLRNVPREDLLKTMSQPISILPRINNSNDKHVTSSIIFVSKAKTSTSPISSMKQIQQPIITSIQNVDVERALFDFYQCSQINDIDNCLPNNNENSESEDLEYSLSNYNEICEETSSLLRLNEQHSSAFLDDESGVDDYSLKTKQTQQSRHLTYSQNNNYFMKMMMLNKTRRNLTIDTTSDDRTTTNSFSLNTYSEDFSIDKIYQYDSASSYKQQFNISSPNHPMSQHSWCSSSSTATATTPSSCQEKQMPLLLLRTSSPQNFLTAVEKKRTTSSDSDGITTTTTTLTNSTQYEGRDIDKTKQKATNSISQDVLRASNKLNATTITDVSEIQKNHTKEIVLIMNKAINIDTKYHSLSDTLIRDNDTSGYGSHEDPSSINNRVSSKVTFDSFMTHNSAPSSPKTKDQSIMTQTDVRERLNQTNNTSHEPIQDSSENKNGRMVVISEGTVTTGSTSAKSSFKELVQNQKTPIHRKSKSQNRARKALRTITFILGAFVVCWTPWHMYSAIHSLCESCKNNWIFSNPMFHCFYFLCYLNSPINPFCYALANQQFKKTFTRILKLDLRRL
ncbi:unnamed protein product [Rotaria magnacalcarata]|uniref:G-protein coupled receptors family 1 profile domain-containing protein n=2 Tax=Rotaria magnacalcarata TaxID=392030 RepID=A0A816XWP5_9BILA|nr:unnamed protein product [Rotaria magnacalcarata]CAF2150712.1 unnamed protein product [Rotaria magnacalcarata]CAF3753848.1 unnamed protein product [Rotaria magnacalcarata]CAF3789511.1 unnamed protein product [Rotaria magnacalcarata]